MTDLSPSALAEEFDRLFQEACPEHQAALIADWGRRGPELHMAARHPKVGALTISFENEEVTVHVGPYHCHFDRFEYLPDSPDDHDLYFVAPAVHWVRELRADRMVLQYYITDGRSRGGSAGPRDEFDPTGVPGNAEVYTWSGPWRGSD